MATSKKTTIKPRRKPAVKQETTKRKPIKQAVKANQQRISTVRTLRPDELRWRCDEKQFTFSSTAEILPLLGVVGQHRAVEAINLGAEIDSRGFNIFVMSLLGTGRLTTIKQVLERILRPKRKYRDFCYVNNFKNPDLPRLITLENGQAKILSSMMTEAITFLRRRIPLLFEEENFRNRRNALIKKFRDKEIALLSEFDKSIRPKGFALGQIQNESGETQQQIFVLIDNAPVDIDTLDDLVSQGSLSQAKAKKITTTYSALMDSLRDVARKGIALAHEFRNALLAYDRSAVRSHIDTAFSVMAELYADHESIQEYLEECVADLLEHVDIFSQSPDTTDDRDLTSGMRLSEKLQQYTINVLLDNSDTSSPPIIIETSPNFLNLFGTIEKKIDKNGFFRSDFTQIKAGSLLRADGGYLIINAVDILQDINVWNTLKRLLLYGRLEIQSPDSQSITGATIKPQVIEPNVKVILLGDYSTYLTLFEVEEDFSKIFKIAAEFDYETDRGEKMLQNYARFIAKICHEEKLVHAKPSAVAAIVEWGVEQTEDKEKISINFSDVADLIRESGFYAKQNNKRFIIREHVKQALTMRKRRTELQDEKIKHQILQGTLLIDTHGGRVGQINGLTVYSTGLISFGKPARITVTTGAGNAGLVNIEREADFSGNIHTKGVFIIAGFLRHLFAQHRPLALSASISFEQSYGGVDGDSASAAEMYALLSSLASIPINQNLAVTGSINQLGDIQPVGGVNEKIHGFFEICNMRGLDGTHGVIIPQQNVVDLMLDQVIVDAVKQGLFHVYPISRFEEGVPLLMNIEAGEKLQDFHFTEGSLFDIVDKRLDSIYKTVWQAQISL